MILACDVGGTKTNLALFEEQGGVLELVRVESFPSRDHHSLEEIVERFVGSRPPRLRAAGFGVAGPVLEGRVQITNLPWLVDGSRLAGQLGLPTVALLNDLEAHAWAVERLKPSDLATLQEGVAAPGNIAVIAAGTGLGVSALIRAPGGTVSLASEGGHADFAPHGGAALELLRYLQTRFGHVSVERVVAGPGLVHIYEFLRDDGRAEEPAWLAEEMRADDPAAVVSRAGIEGRSALCTRAVDLYLEAYGAEAGNWALRTLSRGGVYLGGGIAAKLLCEGPGVPDAWPPRARESFLRGFLEKGRLRPLLEKMAVRVIVNDKAALLGAAHYASMGRAA